MNANEPSPNPSVPEESSKARKVVGGAIAAGAVAFGGNALASGVDQGEAQKAAEPAASVAEAPADTLPVLTTEPSETTITVAAPETTVAPTDTAEPTSESPAEAPAPTEQESPPVTIGGQTIVKNEDGTQTQTVFPVTPAPEEPAPAPENEAGAQPPTESSS